MRCVKCGNDCPDGVKFCARCGNIMSIQENKIKVQAVHQTSVKRLSGRKLTVIAAIAGVLLILVTVLIINALSDQSIYTYQDSNSLKAISIQPMIEGYEGISFVTSDGTWIMDKKITTWEDCQSSLSQHIFAVLTKGDLFLVTKKGFEEVLHDVNTFVLSADGSHLAYTVADVQHKKTLYLYDVHEKKSTRISEDVAEKQYVISPDGEYTAFVKDYVSENDFKLCICREGKEIEVIGMNKIPIAISNDARYLYYMDSGKLIVRNTEEALRLSAEFAGSIYFNDTNTEIMFSDDGKTFLSTYGQEKQKICNKQLIDVILPDTVCCQETGSQIAASVIGAKHLSDLVYEFDESFYYLSASLELTKLCTSNVRDYAISEDNTKLLFSDGLSLYYISDILAIEPSVTSIIEYGTVNHFVSDPDLSYVYYVNENDELIYQPIDGAEKKIADEVTDEYYFMDQTDQYVYFLTDTDHFGIGKLYYTKEGSTKKTVNKASEVSLVAYGGNIYYEAQETKEGNHLMVLKKGKAIVAKSE